MTSQGAIASPVEPMDGLPALHTYAELNALLVVFVYSANMGTHAHHVRVCTPLLHRRIARLFEILPCSRAGVSARKSGVFKLFSSLRPITSTQGVYARFAIFHPI